MLKPHAFTILAWCCCRYWHKVAVVVEMLLGFWKGFLHDVTIMTHFLWSHDFAVVSYWPGVAMVTDMMLLWLLPLCWGGCCLWQGCLCLTVQAPTRKAKRSSSETSGHPGLISRYRGCLVHTHACMHTPTPTSPVHIHTPNPPLLYMDLCTHLPLHAHRHTHPHTHTTCVCMCAHKHTHAHTHTHTHTHQSYIWCRHFQWHKFFTHTPVTVLNSCSRQWSKVVWSPPCSATSTPRSP